MTQSVDSPGITSATEPMNIESASVEYSEDMGVILFKCSLRRRGPQTAVGCVLTMYRSSDKNLALFPVTGSTLDFMTCLQLKSER